MHAQLMEVWIHCQDLFIFQHSLVQLTTGIKYEFIPCVIT